MGRSTISHIAGDVFNGTSSAPTWVAIGLIFVASGLSVLHLHVKHGRHQMLRPVLAALAGGLALALFSAAVPSSGAQFPPPVAGLPDLISDPPFIWFERIVEVEDEGPLHRMIAFDGYLHNIGEGSLDLFGNPQQPGGMVQRVFDGTNWEEVGSPTVRYETSDGHNHFHLIGAVDYSLWDESLSEKIGDSSKVGFCLVDTEQQEDRYEEFYGIDRFDYCSRESPDATELRMGITPGWRDTYDANITLQWVDATNTAPGRYFVGAVTDPNDEIVESDETNNGLVFSQNKFILTGYKPLSPPPVVAEGATDIGLSTRSYGQVGKRAFIIADPPAHGSLDVPANVDLHENTVVYTPEPGFVGEDSFTFEVRDTDSMFPVERTAATVTIEVVAGNDSADDPESDGADAVDSLTISGPETVEVERYSQADFAFQTTADSLSWYAGDLPPGLWIDRETGLVQGTAIVRGDFRATIVATDGVTATSREVDVIVPKTSRPPMRPVNDFSTALGDGDLRYWIGSGTDDAEYSATGMPDGAFVVSNLPIVTGAPTELGVFDVTVTETVDGTVVDEVSFTWTVRSSAVPAFPL